MEMKSEVASIRVFPIKFKVFLFESLSISWFHLSFSLLLLRLLLLVLDCIPIFYELRCCCEHSVRFDLCVMLWIEGWKREQTLF